MSDDVRFERLLAVVLVDAAPTRAPDRLVPDILAATSRARRRPRWLAFVLERPMRLNTQVVVGSRGTRAATFVFLACLAAALGVGTVVGAASLMPTPTPVPSPTTRPSPATGLSPLPTFKPLADRSGCCLGNPNYLPGLGYRLPAGWTQVANTMHSEVFVLSTALARGTVALHWAAAVATNERDCAGVVAPGVGTTSAEMAAALENDPRLVASAAQAASVAGYTGQTLDLRLDANWSGTCSWSGGKPAALLVTAGGEQVGPSFGITGLERVRVFILDVYPGSDPTADPSVVAWFGISADEASFDAVLSEAMPLVDSFTFHP